MSHYPDFFNFTFRNDLSFEIYLSFIKENDNLNSDKALLYLQEYKVDLDWVKSSGNVPSHKKTYINDLSALSKGSSNTPMGVFEQNFIQWTNGLFFFIFFGQICPYTTDGYSQNLTTIKKAIKITNLQAIDITRKTNNYTPNNINIINSNITGTVTSALFSQINPQHHLDQQQEEEINTPTIDITSTSPSLSEVSKTRNFSPPSLDTTLLTTDDNNIQSDNEYENDDHLDSFSLYDETPSRTTRTSIDMVSINNVIEMDSHEKVSLVISALLHHYWRLKLF
ncbi:unnamed protein product [Cunninghamella blakesleeana]